MGNEKKTHTHNISKFSTHKYSVCAIYRPWRTCSYSALCSIILVFGIWNALPCFIWTAMQDVCGFYRENAHSENIQMKRWILCCSIDERIEFLEWSACEISHDNRQSFNWSRSRLSSGLVNKLFDWFSFDTRKSWHVGIWFINKRWSTLTKPTWLLTLSCFAGLKCFFSFYLGKTSESLL